MPSKDFLKKWSTLTAKDEEKPDKVAPLPKPAIPEEFREPTKPDPVEPTQDKVQSLPARIRKKRFKARKVK